MIIRPHHLPLKVKGAESLKGRVLTIPTPKRALTSFMDALSQTSEQNLHGGIEVEGIAQSISSGSSPVITFGISRALLVLNAGIDAVGDITLSGTSIDRDNGQPAILDSEVIAVNGLSTDNSLAGFQLPTLFDFDDAYISTKWWTGAVTFSSTNVNLSDVDIYSIAYEQFDDTDGITIVSIDNTMKVEATAGNWEHQGYVLRPKSTPTANGCDLERFANMTIASPTTNKWYRKRLANLDISINGAQGEGFLCAADASTGRTYTSWTHKVWYTQEQ